MKAISTQSMRIGIALVLLLAIGGWQWEFVLHGLQANIPLNSLIFGTFTFGLVLVWAQMRMLQNEHRALYSLIEHNQDAMAAARGEQETKWRLARCTKVGIVFEPPVVLGQAYQLLSEQLYREGRVSVSTDTLHNLIESANSRLTEQRSLINYVAGILVLLGLIGTFIGLMVTLSSVGEILGSLDFSSDDPTATVALLIANLKTPLGGMATGFSSSLFGLVTSLTLSMLIQLVSRAGVSLRGEFANWLGTAAALAPTIEHSGNGQAGAAGNGVPRDVLALLMRTSQHLVNRTQENNERLDKLTSAVEGLVQNSADQSAEMAALTSNIHTVQEQNLVLHQSVCRSVEAYRQLAETADFSREMSELAVMITSQAEQRDLQLVGAEKRILRRLEAVRVEPASDEKKEIARLEAKRLSMDLAEGRDKLTVDELRGLLNQVFANRRKASGEETNQPNSGATRSNVDKRGVA